MQKYNWSIDTLITRAEDLEKLYKFEARKKEPDLDLLEKIKFDYDNIKSEVFELRNYSNYETPTILENYNYLKSSFIGNEFLWPDLNFFAELTKNRPIINRDIKRNSFSKEDLLTLVHDFYRELGNSFYGNFMKCFYRRKDHTRFLRSNFNEECEGNSIHLHTFNESFITVRRNNTIKDFTNLIHEYTHATLFQINPNHDNDPNNIFIELLPTLFETLALDYYYQKTKDSNAVIEKINDYNGNIMRSNYTKIIRGLIDEERELEKPFTTNKELKEVALNKLGLTCQELNGILENPLSIPDILLENYIFSIELYYLYTNDKDKFLSTIKKIALLNNLSREEYYQALQKLGLIPNLHTKEFRDSLKGYALTLNRVEKI